MSTLTDYEVTVWEGTDQNANKFSLGSKLQTAQTDITTLQDQVAAIDGNYPVAKGYGYIGTRTVVQINALTPATGMVVVAGSAGTPTAGTSSLLAIGDVAEYDGTNWIKIVAHSGGFVPDTTVLIVAPASATLYSPLTTGTDGGKLATFGGASNTPSLTVPADGIAYAVTGTSVNAGKIYQFQTGAGWSVVTTALSNSNPANLAAAAAPGVSVQGSRADHVHALPLSDATPADLGVASAGTAVLASRADHVHTLPAGAPTDYQVYNDAGIDRITNTATETPFATDYTLSANALAQGAEWDIEARVYVAGVTGTPDLIIRLNVAGAAVSAVQVTSVTADAQFDLRAQIIVGKDGASGVAVMNVNGISYTSAVVGTQKPGAYIGAFDTTTSKDIVVTAEWSAASASNQADLRLLRSSYRAASV